MTTERPRYWRRLYTAMALVGAGMGVLLVLGLLPATPQRITAWIRNADNRLVALLVPILGGALVGLVLTATAHVGVLWQLRRRSRFEDKNGGNL